MDELTLHRVSAGGRISLEGIVDPEIEFYTAARAEDGLIVLRPVAVVNASGRLRKAEDMSTHLVGD